MPKNGQDLKALDCLLVLAFLEGVSWGAPLLTGPEPRLNTPDQEALDALGPDLARRLLDEEVA